MSISPEKNRKRNKGIASLPSGFSKSLWDARNLIAQGQNDQGLAALNQLAAATKNPRRRAKILMLVGESQAKLSRHTDAAAAFSRASENARQAADLDLLLNSGAGQIRSLLRSLRTDEAKTAAASLLAELDKAQQDYQKILSLTPAQLAACGALQIAAQPPRPTVVLTKIANAFIESGLTDDARVFLQKALTLSPNGAARARQSLAKLALASDDPALAERYARESLLMGRFQAKTIAAWQLYLDARARQDLTPILELDVFASFQANAKGRIATASIHCIVRVLRTHGDPTWKTIAQSALADSASDSIIATELEKLIQADAKLTGSQEPREIAARALKLFRAQDVSAQEQVGHAKVYARYSLLAGSIPNTNLVSRQATERFGALHTSAVRHAMALGAIQARETDRARTWLIALLTDLTPGSEPWGKATWALARLAEDLENPGEASVWYFQLAENPLTPPRFRIQAMLKGFRDLATSGGEVDTPKVSATVSAILNTVDDYKFALDAARQLSLAGPSFVDLKFQAAQRGKSLAATAFQNASTSREKLAIIEYVARRQVSDLGDYTSISDRWDQIPLKERVEFETLAGSLWYEYVSILFRAFTQTNRIPEAEALVASIIDRDRSTPEGYVIVGTEYAEWLLKDGQKAKAFEYFDWIAKESPTHRRAAVAHYWIAIRSLKNGSNKFAVSSARSVHACYGGSPSLLPEWEFDAAALMIIYSMNSEAAISAANVGYSISFLSNAAARVARQLKQL